MGRRAESSNGLSISGYDGWIIRVTAGDDNTSSTIENHICRAVIRVDVDLAGDILEGIMPVISPEVKVLMFVVVRSNLGMKVSRVGGRMVDHSGTSVYGSDCASPFV